VCAPTRCHDRLKVSVLKARDPASCEKVPAGLPSTTTRTLPPSGPTRPNTAIDEASIRSRAEALALAFWAGPLTMVLRRAHPSAGWDLGGDPETIGVRMPHHPLALAVLALAGPLAVTSANRSARPTPSTCEGVREVFRGSVDVYLCEPEPLGGAASTVVDLAHGAPRVTRVGAVSEADLLAALAVLPA